MSRASTFIAAVWPSIRASKTSGLWPISRDRDLARLLAGEAPPGLSDTARNILLDLWWRTIEVPTPIRARTIKGRQIKTTKTKVARGHAGNPPRWPAARFGLVRRPRSDGAIRDEKSVGGIWLRNRRHCVLALNALGAALARPTPETAKRRHHAFWTNRHATPPIYTQEGPTFLSRPVMPVTMQ